MNSMPREVNMTVMNPQGQVVRAEVLISRAGTISEQVDLSDFPKGLYFIRLTTEQFTQVEKVVVN